LTFWWSYPHLVGRIDKDFNGMLLGKFVKNYNLDFEWNLQKISN
jgi:hypothetical protein